MQPTERPKKAIDRAHPLRVAPRQVVVDGDDVHALRWQRVEIDRQGRDQRLALAGLHLGDHAAVQDDAAQQLHIEMALAQRSLGRLADRRERLHQQIIDRFAAIKTLPEPRRARAQFIVAHCLELWLERVDRDDVLVQPFRNRSLAVPNSRRAMAPNIHDPQRVARDLDRARAGSYRPDIEAPLPRCQSGLY